MATTAYATSNMVLSTVTGQQGSFDDVNAARLIPEPFAVVPGTPFVGGIPYVYTAPSGIRTSPPPPSTAIFLGPDELVSSPAFPLTLSGTLVNLGGGANPFSSLVQGIRSITSTNASLTITEDTDTIDLTLATLLTSAGGGGTETLVNTGSSSTAFLVKGLSANTGSSGISLDSSNVTRVTIGASAITLASAGGTVTLLGNGTGPAFTIKGLTAGSGISIDSITDPTQLIIGLTTSLTTAGGAETLVSNGANPVFSLKGLTAGTGISLDSITNPTQVILSNAPITLGSAGGTVSLVNDGIGPTFAMKGLTAGTGISMGSSILNVNFSTPLSLWTQTDTNIISTTDADTIIRHGVSNVVGSRSISSAILASTSSTFANSFRIEASAIFAALGGANNSNENLGGGGLNVVIGCNGTSQRNLSGVNFACNGGIMTNNGTTLYSGGNVACASNNHYYYLGQNCTAASTLNNTISGYRIWYAGCISASACTINTTATNTFSSRVSMVASNACTATNALGTDFVCASDNLNYSSTLNSFFCSSGDLAIINTSNHFYVKKLNGAAFYSSTDETTGVTLAAGGSSWASVSDSAKKENLAILDYNDVLDRLDKLNIYSYNYVGNPPAQRCYGTTAQEWHREDTFKCPNAVLGEGKTHLAIEIQDQIGVLMASVKALYAKVKAIEETRRIN